MYCKHCGKQISDESCYCKYCGNETTQRGHMKTKYTKVFLILCLILCLLLVLGTAFTIYKMKLSKPIGNWKAYSCIAKDGKEEKITEESYGFLMLSLNLKANHKLVMKNEKFDESFKGTWTMKKNHILLTPKIEDARVTFEAKLEDNDLIVDFHTMQMEKLSIQNSTYNPKLLIYNGDDSPEYIPTGEASLLDYTIRFKKQ